MKPPIHTWKTLYELSMNRPSVPMIAETAKFISQAPTSESTNMAAIAGSCVTLFGPAASSSTTASGTENAARMGIAARLSAEKLISGWIGRSRRSDREPSRISRISSQPTHAPVIWPTISAAR